MKEANKLSLGWSWMSGLIYSIAVYFGSQFAAGFIFATVFSVFAVSSASNAQDWFNSSTLAQFIYVLLIEGLIVGLVVAFVRRRKVDLGRIGFTRFKPSHIMYALMGFGIYFPSFIIFETVVKFLVPSINVGQHQDLPFNSYAHGHDLILIFMSLVILPPIAEEILCRGLLYTSLRQNFHKIYAALMTSVLFGVAHLQIGSGNPLVWVAAIDTFVLSMVLILLRDKTDSLWPSIILHAIKNCMAFLVLFVFHAA